MKDHMAYQAVDDMLKGARRAQGLTRTALAKLLQARANTTAVTPHVISRWERGIRIPSPYWRSHLAPVLKIKPTLLDHSAKASRRRRKQQRQRCPGTSRPH